MRPWVPRPPDKARWSHTDINHGHDRSLVSHVEFVGVYPLGQNRFGFRTDVGLTFLEARENVAIPSDEESRRPTSPGGLSLEGEQRPADHDESNEDESDPTFPEHVEIGGVIGVRLPARQNHGGPGVRGLPDPNVPLAGCGWGMHPVELGSPSGQARSPLSWSGACSFRLRSGSLRAHAPGVRATTCGSVRGLSVAHPPRSLLRARV